MALLKRFKFAYRAFKGEAYQCGDDRYIFPNRIVQLMPWRDTIVALDSQGRIYEMRDDYSGFKTIQLVLDNIIN